MAERAPYNALGSIDRATGTVTTVSLGATQTSGPMPVTNAMENFSYQFAVVSGTPSGTFEVHVSNDPRVNDPNFNSSAVWTVLPTVTFTSGVTSTGASNCFITVQNGAKFSRCQWTRTGGTGTGWALGCGYGL